MARTLYLACLALLFAALGPAAAHADGLYFEEGIGSSSIGGDLGQVYDGSLLVKMGLGVRIENLSAGMFFAANLIESKAATPYQKSAPYSTETATLLRYGAEARYFIPTGRHLRLYMRGGVSSNHLSGSRLGEMRGRGIDYGTGAMFSTKVRALGFLFWPGFFTGVGPKVSLSLWGDLGGHYARLHHDRNGTLDVRTSAWSLGVTVGGGF